MTATNSPGSGRDVAAHPSVQRVRTALAELGIPDRIRTLDASTRTAREAAEALGVEVGQIASSLLFLADGTPVLVIASGAHRVDTARLAHELGVTHITKPNADEVRAATGFAIGGVAPVGHPEPLLILIDRSLAAYDEVWAAGGHPYAVFASTFSELLEITGAREVNVQLEAG